MNNIFIVLVLLSLVALSNANFVYDKRLLNKKQIGRDFSGSVRYGSFLYSGSCPPTTSGLAGISIALADSTGSSCFTDASTGAVSTTIGYICTPGINGGPATIEFGFPGTNGFVIGGANFAGVGVADPLGFKWGSVGQPTYTGGSATASCSSTCTSTYCGGHCTATCSDTKTSTGESCVDTNSGGTYYFVPIAVNPTNCGSLGSCCTSFSYPQASCIGNPNWTPVTCTTTSWVWSMNRNIATTLSAANSAHLLATEHNFLTCSLDGTGWVSTSTFTMTTCDTLWYHIGGSYTGNCGGHNGESYKLLALGQNDCYVYNRRDETINSTVSISGVPVSGK